MTIPDRLKKFTTPIPVLNDGHVQLIDVMGDDIAIVDAARISFFGFADEHTAAENRHLLRYLMRSRHTGPFEMCELKIRVRVPMDVWRQWIRHRTASVNESSTRYAPAIDAAMRAPAGEWRAQSKSNKQGSDGFVTEWPEYLKVEPGDQEEQDQFGPLCGWIGTDFYASPGEYLSQHEHQAQRLAREVYEERLAFGVAREVARKDLPLSTYTEAYWKIDCHNLLHFLRLRLDPHAQYEIRQYAEAIAEIVKVWVPWTWEAFEDYVRESMTFSRMEILGLKAIFEGYCDAAAEHCVQHPEEDALQLAVEESGLPKGRERKEFEAKLARLMEA